MIFSHPIHPIYSVIYLRLVCAHQTLQVTQNSREILDVIQNPKSAARHGSCVTLQSLQSSGGYCNTPQHTATHCNTLQHDRSSLKRSGRYYHTLQHTATQRIRGALLLSSLQSRKYTALHCVLQYVAASSYAACCSVTCACYFRNVFLKRVPRRAAIGARSSRDSTYFRDKRQVSNKSTHTSPQKLNVSRLRHWPPRPPRAVKIHSRNAGF